ncbi:pantoate--beta-alanine ligase [Geminicoccaceae bacterium 1502E]|nr:pantoate--beta-alanine ligase [Geminicoccaceae bacterium 1502E]
MSAAGDAGLPEVVSTVAGLRQRVAAWRAQGLTVGFVPTMGALHAGHLALVRHALERCDRALVSIFVNPSQFAANEDLDRYPRTLESDRGKLAAMGAHLVFAPSAREMYPADFTTGVAVGGLGEGLCAVTRPHFFGGVATVVTKLLNQAQADIAVFGEKDYQQLLVVRRLARDLDIPTEIVGHPTEREEDGLALSSRNAYLSVDQRRTAAGLPAVLQRTAASLAGGAPVGGTLARAREELLACGFSRIDYVELRDSQTLAPVDPLGGREARLLAAAWLGEVRLIDNLAVAAAR